MPRAKRAKSKPSRSDGEQLDLLKPSLHKVSAHAAVADDAVAQAGADPRKLGDRIWNAIVGLCLLPFAWIVTDALFDTFAHAASRGTHGRFWLSHDFLMFSIGAAGWLAWMCISCAIWKRPRPLRAYILGHELMHMLVARLSRGRIKDYHISSEGGYIVTNKYNFLIALAPYLWPFYSVPVLAAWSVSLYWKEALFYREWFLGALGFTWMFHLTFTLWILPHGQSDFHGPGRIFSLVFIYLVNAILLGSALVILAPQVTWHRYGSELWMSSKAFYEWAGHAVSQAVDLVGHLVRRRTG